MAYPWQGPYVILMPMCNDDGLYFVLPFCQKCGVGQDLVHAQVSETAMRIKLLSAELAGQGWQSQLVSHG